MVSNFQKIEDKKEWQNLLGKVLFKTFFHSREWEEFLEKEFKWLKFERYNWQDKALLSLARARISGKEKLISHPFCEYGGPLPLIQDIDGRAFQKDLFEQFEEPLKISFHPYLLNYFKGFDVKDSLRETYLLQNLSKLNVETVGDRNRHRQKNKAQDSGLTVEKCKTENDLKILYDFYVKSLKKHKALVYPFSFFKFFFKNSQAEILLVKKGERAVGGNIFLAYSKSVHSFLCGFDERYRKLGAHTLVLWSELKWKQQEGFETFDFGAVRKGSSIGDFKNRWGAGVFPVFELKNYTGESKLKNSFLRDVWSYLPSFAIKKISPRLLKYKL
ncbi:MAG: GNAT family N-acetyltransferase [Candidatus Nealsonbacteria bacterium]